MQVRAMIEALNSLSVGELASLRRKVEEVRDHAARQGLEEITAILDDALAQLAAGDLRAFRRRVSHAVSRLGHVRPPVETRG